MAEYHILRKDREILDPAEILEIVRGQDVLTVAMSREDVPYLVSVNYAYDPERGVFYFHGAKAGKKVEYIKRNPTVWCQVLEDRGYLPGACDWAYRSVHFPGTARFLRGGEEKRRALVLLLEKLEKDPKARRRVLEEADLGKVAVCRIEPGPFTGKENLGPSASSG